MIEQLNDEFGIEQHITFENGHGDLPKAVISNKFAAVEVYLHGAHVTSFKPHGAEEVLWVSDRAVFADGKAIRGGIPIIWPWFGDHKTDASMPAHGFVRTRSWAVSETKVLPGERTQISFKLSDSDDIKSLWPHPFLLEVHVTVGPQLQVDLVTHNRHSEGVDITQALHTYFRVGDSSKTVVQGLRGRNYLDKVRGFDQFPQYGDIPFVEEVDRVYLETTDECVIVDEVLARQIHIDKLGSRSTVVWNPWIDKAVKMGDFPDDGYKTMICVETTNAAADVRRVPPRDEHTLTQMIRVG